MKADVLEITRDVAADWLKGQRKNRRLKESLVKDIARQIRAGEWEENGESIVFDEHDRLIDGQHRLHAIVMAGMSVVSVVVTKVNGKVFDTIDTGKTRTAADVIGMSGGWANETTAATAVKYLFRYYDQPEFETVPNLTNREVLKIAKQYSDVKQSIEFVNRVGIRASVLSQPECVFLHYILSAISPGKTTQYLKKIMTGNNITQGSIEDRVRARLVDARTTRVEYKLNYKQRLGLVIKGFNVLRDGEMPSKARFVPRRNDKLPRAK